MPSDSITNCQVGLNDNLDEVLAALAFSTSAFKTYANSGDILAFVAQNAELRNVVQEFRASTQLTDLNFIFQSLYVQAWSAFELFIRMLIVSYLEEICKRASDYESLKKAKLIDRNLYHSGVALQQVLENRSNLNIDFTSIAKNIGTSVPDSKDVVLNVLSFGIFLKGPSARGVEEALRRIGITDFNWDTIGGAKAVQKALGTQRVRDTAKQVTEFLQSAEKIRNNIVHRGENIQPVTEADLRQEVGLFRVIGNALVEFLKGSLV
jgi:hypothetical protein